MQTSGIHVDRSHLIGPDHRSLRRNILADYTWRMPAWLLLSSDILLFLKHSGTSTCLLIVHVHVHTSLPYLRLLQYLRQESLRLDCMLLARLAVCAADICFTYRVRMRCTAGPGGSKPGVRLVSVYKQLIAGVELRCFFAFTSSSLAGS